jgi:peptidoglycan/xylan/chitin deacetylase (PgdA/CDA1 family)
MALPEKPVMITFDDWTPGQYALAYPALKEFGFTAVFYVISGMAEKPGEKEKIREMAADGFEIGSHTVHHYYLTQDNCNKEWKCCHALKLCSEAEMRSEIFDSRSALERIGGAAVLSIAWPGNYFNGLTMRLAAEAGYTSAFAVEEQVMEDGILTNRVGVTTEPMKIYRTEIDGFCGLDLFPAAVVTQRCCVKSDRPFHRHCLPQEK